MSTVHDLIPTEDPSEADTSALLATLRAYNATQVGLLDPRPFAVLIKTNGATVGGVSGHTGYGWMFVKYLALPAPLRGGGTGTRLMRAAEDIARTRGCSGIWLDTFSFQARGFYEKLGFAVFGAIDDYPIGHQRFFMSKHLT